MKQANYYLRGYFRKEEHPFPMSENQKFNPLQGLTYAMAMYIGVPLIIITGIGLMFPEAIIDKVFGVSGLLVSDLLHIVTGFLLSVFMIIHIYLCTLGLRPSRHFKAILNGWHEPA